VGKRVDRVGNETFEEEEEVDGRSVEANENGRIINDRSLHIYALF
jgi:hypothetical protein